MSQIDNKKKNAKICQVDKATRKWHMKKKIRGIFFHTPLSWYILGIKCMHNDNIAIIFISS